MVHRNHGPLGRFSALMVAGGVMLAGCGTDDGVAPQVGLDASPPSLAADRVSAQAGPAPAAISTSPVLSFADLSEMRSSRVVRRAAGVAGSVRVEGMEPGTAVTMWIVVFNRPEECASSPCEEEDLFDPDTEADVVYGAGHVVGGSGRLTLAGHLPQGANDGSLFGTLGLPAPGLQDIWGAEVHLVVRSHGPKLPGLMRDMIHTFNGGCTHPGPGFPDPLPPELGAAGPNECVDIAFAIHLP